MNIDRDPVNVALQTNERDERILIFAPNPHSNAALCDHTKVQLKPSVAFAAFALCSLRLVVSLKTILEEHADRAYLDPAPMRAVSVRAS